MANEWLFLIIILFVALVVGGILLYYFLNINKRKYLTNTDTIQRTNEPTTKYIVLNNLEGMLRETINKQNNIYGAISLLIQRIDNLEKIYKNISDASSQIKNSLVEIKTIPAISKDNRSEKLCCEIEKIVPFIKTSIDTSSGIELKLQEQTDILKNVKDILQSKVNQAVPETKVEVKGIEELKSKINEITTLLKAISGP